MLFESFIKDFISALPWKVRKEKKKNIRVIVEQHRRIYTEEEAKRDSAIINAKIEEAEWFKNAQSVMIYYPIRNEVNLMPLFEKYKAEKTFILPVTHRYTIEPRPIESVETLKKGHFGIKEPQTSTYTGKIDLILVPGVAFDKQGHRIGRGRGYYDRFLRINFKAKKIGVAYDFQVVKSKLPTDRRDVQLDGIVSPTHSTI